MLEMLNNPIGWIGSFAVLGGIFAFWGQLRNIFSQLVGIFFVTDTTNGYNSLNCIVGYLNSYKTISFDGKNIFMNNLFIKNSKKRKNIFLDNLQLKTSIHFMGWWPVILNWQNTSSNKNRIGDNRVTLTYIRHTIDIVEFLRKAEDFYQNTIDHLQDFNSSEKTRFFVKNIYGNRKRHNTNDSSFPRSNEGIGVESPPETPTPMGTLDINTLFYGSSKLMTYKKDEISIGDTGLYTTSAIDLMSTSKEIEEAYSEFQKWKKSEQWYKDKQIVWNRGFLLYGPPGTGKSSFVKVLAYDFDMPIFCFDLQSMSNKDFYSSWENIKNTNKSCIVLIEDIDSIFNGRVNVSNHLNDGLSYDCFLNTISGVNNSHGVFLIITTNNIEKIDEALGIPSSNNKSMSSRPGRIDRIVKFDILDKQGRYKIANRVLVDYSYLIENIVNEGEGDTGAQFQERCTRIALNEYWKNKKL